MWNIEKVILLQNFNLKVLNANLMHIINFIFVVESMTTIVKLKS